MAYQFIIIHSSGRVTGTSVAADALSYQVSPGYTVVDATNQNLMTHRKDSDQRGLASGLINVAIPLAPPNPISFVAP